MALEGIHTIEAAQIAMQFLQNRTDVVAGAPPVNPDLNRVKTFTYVYVGVASAIAGVFIVSILTTFWPNTGEGYLLVILAAIFVGGNPLIGGVGTVVGALIGSFTVGFIETGIIAAGLDGFYTRFAFGIVLIVSLLGFRTQKR